MNPLHCANLRANPADPDSGRFGPFRVLPAEGGTNAIVFSSRNFRMIKVPLSWHPICPMPHFNSGSLYHFIQHMVCAEVLRLEAR
jgi:hypothetical protein